LKETKCALIDVRAREALDAPLRGLGLAPVYLQPSPFLPPPMDSHPDIRCAVVGRKVIHPPGDENIFRGIANIKLLSGAGVPRGGYPGDAAYNCAVVGNRLIHNLKYTDQTILDCAQSAGMALVHVNQGYAKCATCVVGDNAAITSDKGMYAAFVKSGVNCLLISEGHIRLEGYHHGFIGGASGMLDNRTLLFTGDIALHPDGELVKRFAASKNVSIICLTGRPLFDIGTIFVL